CNAPAQAGIKLVLDTRLKELIDWRKTALDWTDPEGVHSMRVASRRLRSALRDFQPYLPRQSFNSEAKQLKGIADALGKVRDSDVAILALDEIEKHTPAAHSAALKQFVEKRKKLREQPRKELKAVLAKGELKKVESDFAASLDGATASAERRKRRNPEHTFATMSQAIILDRLKEFEKRSDGLFRPFDVEALHDLRIAAKRLRYAIELLGACFSHSISIHAKRAARIQTALGDLHDCDSWIETLGKEIVLARKEKSEEQVTALMWLLNHFTRLRTKHLQRAFARWREWETHDSSGKLRSVLAREENVVVAQKTGPQPESQLEVPAGEQIRQGL
ncbi:MAG TPA: CHAD domain-containing protein, partial [Pyrinomonadaceae bacterium]